MVRSLLVSGCCLLWTAGCVRWADGTGPKAPPMEIGEALALSAAGRAVFVDLRSRGEFDEGHIPGALNVPAQEIDSRADEIRRLGRLPILYCGG